MQEIEKGIYYEDTYAGVTVGALTLSRGTILIDAPLRAEDSRSWRAALLNRGSGIDRVLINLDSHPDRTIGVRSLECPVVAHDYAALVFRNRPPTFKVQSTEMGAEWEMCADLGSSRWAVPDITFSEQVLFHWGEPEVLLEYHPGASPGASWVVIPDARVAFIGDTVPVNQTPFLAEADIPAWLESLEMLLSSKFRAYLLISGRGGPVTVEDVRTLRNVLKKTDKKLNSLWGKSAPVMEVYKLIPGIMSDLNIPEKARNNLYEQRLRYGLERYYTRHFLPDDEITVEDE